MRGIRKISIDAPVATNLWPLKYRLAYFAIAGIACVSFITLQCRQTRAMRTTDERLAETNEFLTLVSQKHRALNFNPD